MKIKYNMPKCMGCSKSSSKREVHSNRCLPQKNKKNQIKSIILHLKDIEKEEQTKPKVSRSEGITKIRAEIN